VSGGEIAYNVRCNRALAWYKETMFSLCAISRINNTFICPIVFTIVEEMKAALPWRR